MKGAIWTVKTEASKQDGNLFLPFISLQRILPPASYQSKYDTHESCSSNTHFSHTFSLLVSILDREPNIPFGSHTEDLCNLVDIILRNTQLTRFPIFTGNATAFVSQPTFNMGNSQSAGRTNPCLNMASGDSSSTISAVLAREILDSRGNPTVEVRKWYHIFVWRELNTPVRIVDRCL